MMKKIFICLISIFCLSTIGCSKIDKSKYDDVHEFSEDLAVVEINGKFGYVDKEGNLATEVKYNSASSIKQGIGKISVSDGDGIIKYGIVNGSGKVLVEPKYDRISDFKNDTCEFWEDWAEIELNNGYGFINKLGEEVLEPKYDMVKNEFHADRAVVIINGKSGFIDRSGEVVIEPKFDNGGRFEPDGYASVEFNGEWIYIDKYGRVVSISEKLNLN